MISEAIVPINIYGRPISIFELSKYLSTFGGPVKWLEVPCPRIEITEIDGMPDHIEIVLKPGLTLEKFVIKYESKLLTFVTKDYLDEKILLEKKQD